MSSTDKSAAHKAIVRRYVEAINKGDLETLRTLFTKDAVIRGVLGWGSVDKLLPIWKELHDSLQIHLTVEEMIGEGDIVAVRYTERGKFVGPYRGQQPTGKPYELVVIEWFVFQDGKIRRRWGPRDAESQAKQIGMMSAA